ncbi:MAG: LiaF domain-containing protein [Acidimicrobiia bacterium]
MQIAKLPWKAPALVLAGVTLASLVSAVITKSRLPVVDDPSGERISLVSVFSGTALRPTTHSFRGGTIVSMFGGTALDLRRAGLPAEGAHLNITTAYGGTEITVPDTWSVVVDGTTVLGGVSVRAVDATAGSSPRLTIDAKTVFGGLSVTGRPVLRAADTPA